jgi:hypothetical protein
MAAEDACSADMLVLIHWYDGRTTAVPLSQLFAIDTDQATQKPLATGISGGAESTRVQREVSTVEAGREGPWKGEPSHFSCMPLVRDSLYSVVPQAWLASLQSGYL